VKVSRLGITVVSKLESGDPSLVGCGVESRAKFELVSMIDRSVVAYSLIGLLPSETEFPVGITLDEAKCRSGSRVVLTSATSGTTEPLVGLGTSTGFAPREVRLVPWTRIISGEVIAISEP